MISEKDLRIGNWVNCRYGPLEVTINSIRQYNGFEPIPLSPEILKNIEGIEKTKDGYRIGFSKYISDTSSAFTWLDIERASHGYKMYIGDEFLSVIEHLHILQNWIYLFSGTELIINL